MPDLVRAQIMARALPIPNELSNSLFFRSVALFGIGAGNLIIDSSVISLYPLCREYSEGVTGEGCGLSSPHPITPKQRNVAMPSPRFKGIDLARKSKRVLSSFSQVSRDRVTAFRQRTIGA